MKTTKHTLSLCPTCYLEIPATITTDERGAFMQKTCPHHGASEAMVERDPIYYLYASGLKAQSIYGGHFVDVTRTCQLRCLPADAPVLKYDMTNVPIGEIQIGDELVGFPESNPNKNGKHFYTLQKSIVTDVVESEVSAIEIETDNGTITCSEDHKWMSRAGRWRIASNMKPGQTISTIATVVDPPEFDDDYKMGYIAGVSLGDGTIARGKQGKNKQWDFQYYRLALTDFDILDRVQKFGKDLGIDFHRSDYQSCKHNIGSKLIPWKSYHKPLQKLTTSKKDSVGKIESWFSSVECDSYKKGFIAGFFDAEGCCGKDKLVRLAQVKPNGLLKRVAGYLNHFGFKTPIRNHQLFVNGGQKETLRFWMMFLPACKRKLQIELFRLLGTAKIKSVRKVGSRRMFDITTTTKTFVAYGMASHNCNPCYYNLEKSDPLGMFSIEAIVNECASNINRAPFILTGGEPTLHPHFLDVVKEVSKVGPVELLSNGIKLSDQEFFNDVVPMITDRSGVTHLNLSIHHKESDDWKTVIALARADKIRIESALLVVGSEYEFDKAIEMCREMADVVNTFRIKGASRLWNAKQTSDRVCVSDMLRWLDKFDKPVVHVAMQNNKPCFFNVLFDRMHLMLVSWYDVSNVDLLEIECPPTYRARNGEVCNFVTTALINEGMEKGWIRGARIENKPSFVKPNPQEEMAQV